MRSRGQPGIKAHPSGVSHGSLSLAALPGGVSGSVWTQPWVFLPSPAHLCTGGEGLFRPSASQCSFPTAHCLSPLPSREAADPKSAPSQELPTSCLREQRPWYLRMERCHGGLMKPAVSIACVAGRGWEAFASTNRS